tara:strand:- start:140 stop:1213 length:1074 start_codon:yes stop_codon:yes gene_type:complete
MAEFDLLVNALERCQLKLNKDDRRACLEDVVTGIAENIDTTDTPAFYEVGTWQQPKTIIAKLEPNTQVLIEERSPREPSLKSEWGKFQKKRDSIDIAGRKVKQKLDRRDIERVGIEDVQYRVKSIPSIINKLRRKHIDEVNDIAGHQVIHQDYGDLYASTAWMDEIFEGEVVKKDNFYVDPIKKYPEYKAIHYDLCVGGEVVPSDTKRGEKECKEGKAVEVQLKTARQKKLQDSWHLGYKEDAPVDEGALQKAEYLHIKDVEDAMAGRLLFKPTSTSFPIAIENLTPTEGKDEIPEGKFDRARKRLVESKVGTGIPRGPITVSRMGPNDYRILDGNTTYYVAKEMGVKELEADIIDD